MNTLLYSPSQAKRIEKVRKKRQKQTMRIANAKTSVVYTRVFYGIACACTLFALVCGILLILTKELYSGQTDELYQRITSLDRERIDKINENVQLTEDNATLQGMLDEVSNLVISLNKENAELRAEIVSLKEELAEYQDREEFYEKYAYALVRSDNSRTDITYDQIKELERLCEERGLSEQAVNLILSISMVESGGDETCKNSTSTASGYGQFLSKTGKFVWTRLMKQNGYNHSIHPFDGMTNLTMMVYYIEYLNEKYDGNMTKLIDEYRGEDDPAYRVKLNEYLKKSGAPPYTELQL